MRNLARFLVALVAAVCLLGPVSACPLCKDSIPEATDGTEADPQRLSKAYNYSIFAFLGMPVVLCGAVGLLIWRANRNSVHTAE